MYGFDYQTLYVSEDGGKTYSKAASNLGAGQINSPLDVEGHIWLACTYWGGVQYSTDKGKTFKEIDPLFKTADSVGFGKPAPNSSAPYTVYIVGKYDGYYGVYRSTDLGETWTLINDDSHQWGVYNMKVIGDPNIFGRVYVATNGRGVVVGDDVSNGEPAANNSNKNKKTTTVKKTTTTTTKKATTTTTATKDTKKTGCFAEKLDYPCCSSGIEVIYTDESGEWGIENNEWCGIGDGSSSGDSCFAKQYGYPCCQSCNTIYSDELGLWGVENNEWCGLKSSCDAKMDADCPVSKYGYSCCSECTSVIATDEDGKWGIENNDWCLLPSKC